MLRFILNIVFILSIQQNKQLKMPVNVRVSVSTHVLKRTRAMALLGGRFDFNAPRLRFSGITIGKSVDQDNKVLFEVVLDELLDNTLALHGTSLKYEGPKIRQESDFNVANAFMERKNTNDGEDVTISKMPKLMRKRWL
ncbi:hypothetical protein [Parasitella parasitica]|uniref:Uncharacterized protein n=1 Tax=Parasitella parasitica TaxID=35722 RepID=A0A0B7N5S5_9FUNG|nr:hypothetical protein [Parasitella parasitica]